MDWMQSALDRLGAGLDDVALDFRTDDGRHWRLGTGAVRGEIVLRDAGVLRTILRDPLLALGETYMDGGWRPGTHGLIGVLEVAHRLQARWAPGAKRSRWQRLLAALALRNTHTSARRNVAHHYDLDERLFAAFLDRDLHYSCAYWRDDARTLEDAQRAKCEHIARKLDLPAGARVLDIGCGFGGLAIHLAEHHGAQVTGITLSRHQLEEGRRRVAARGLGDRVVLEAQDYRQTDGEYDAVVSVGMFEHVGPPQYRRFFRVVRERLKATGTALLHTIGVSTAPGPVNPWIRKYIFPGGHLPSASQLTAAVERSGLVLTDLEVWRRHYALTLAEWHRRFDAAWEALSPRFDERFRRMWAFYLAASEAGFRWGSLVVFQAQLTRDRDRLPQTRDYLYR